MESAKALKPGQVSNKMLEKFRDQGFLLIENFFDVNTELEPVKKSIEDLVDDLAEQLIKGNKITDPCKEAGLAERLTFLDKQFPGATVLLHKIGKTTQAFRDVWSNERLLNVMEQLVGPNIAGHPVWNLRPKTPQTENHDVPWHQDSGYLAESGDGTLTVTAWIPLVDATPTNGCLQFLPEIHKQQSVGPHKGCWRNTWYLYMENDDLKALGINDPQKLAVTVPVSYGSLVIFTNLTPHRSLPNLSKEIRWSLDLRWHDSSQNNGFPWKNSISLRKSDDPQFQPDWNAFDDVNRHDITKTEEETKQADPFDTTIDPKRWTQRWPLLHENRHTACMRSQN